MPAQRITRDIPTRVTITSKPTDSELNVLLQDWVDDVLEPICREQGKSLEDFRPVVDENSARVWCPVCETSMEKRNYLRKPYRHEHNKVHTMCLSYRLGVDVDELREGTGLACGGCGKSFARVDSICRHLAAGTCERSLNRKYNLEQEGWGAKEARPKATRTRRTQSSTKTTKRAAKSPRAHPYGSYSRESSAFSESSSSSTRSLSTGSMSGASYTPMHTPSSSPVSSPELPLVLSLGSPQTQALLPFLPQPVETVEPIQPSQPAPASHITEADYLFSNSGSGSSSLPLYNADALFISGLNTDSMYNPQFHGSASLDLGVPSAIPQSYNFSSNSSFEQSLDFSLLEQEQAAWSGQDASLLYAAAPLEPLFPAEDFDLSAWLI